MRRAVGITVMSYYGLGRGEGWRERRHRTAGGLDNGLRGKEWAALRSTSRVGGPRLYKLGSSEVVSSPAGLAMVIQGKWPGAWSRLMQCPRWPVKTHAICDESL